MNKCLLISMLTVCSCSIAQHQSNCNRALRYSYLKPKLDSAICIPQGYQIMKIYDSVDLNNDGLEDKVVCWQKIKLVDGDTVSYSIYAKENSGNLKLFKELPNLEPIYFKNYSSNSGNEFYDSIKSIYIYPTSTEVEFTSNSINLTFYVDAATIKKLFFSYASNVGTWILTREIRWFAPPKSYEGDEKLDNNGRKLEYDRAVEIPIKIEDFNMLKYINW